MKKNDEVQLLEELANLLERQVELARHGDFAELERLAGQCEPLVARITAAGLLGRPEYVGLRERLGRLYRKLQLVLSAQKDATGEQLKLTHRHQRTLAVYRGNL
jgi:hypothetical protein